MARIGRVPGARDLRVEVRVRLADSRLGAVQADAHAAHLAGLPQAFPAREVALEHAERMRLAARRFVPNLDRLDFEDVLIGFDSIPGFDQ